MSMNAEFVFKYFALSCATGISLSHEDNKNTPVRRMANILKLLIIQ
jgi:hypothetical protein